MITFKNINVINRNTLLVYSNLFTCCDQKQDYKQEQIEHDAFPNSSLLNLYTIFVNLFMLSDPRTEVILSRRTGDLQVVDFQDFIPK